ncbi:MAG: hypothetical protein IPJ74_21100 [Saprospiraceae bacterium]|nr:hypothetical protein [Saprospiraceae bacterium]
MSSNSETGHAKNVANFEKLNVYANGYGAVFQPSKAALQLPELQRLLSESRAIMLTVQQLESNKKKIQNERAAAFKQMKPLCTRIINMLRSSDAADKTVEDAVAINNKIKGIRLTKKENTDETDENASDPATAEVTLYAMTEEGTMTPVTEIDPDSTPEKRTYSHARTSQDQLMEHFSLLLILLETEIHYNPNEQELQLDTLRMYLETLRSTNSAFIAAEVELSNARIVRNHLLYGEKTGICDVAQDVKQYVKALFGVKSPQYKQIKGFKVCAC